MGIVHLEFQNGVVGVWDRENSGKVLFFFPEREIVCLVLDNYGDRGANQYPPEAGPVPPGCYPPPEGGIAFAASQFGRWRETGWPTMAKQTDLYDGAVLINDDNNTGSVTLSDERTLMGTFGDWPEAEPPPEPPPPLPPEESDPLEEPEDVGMESEPVGVTAAMGQVAIAIAETNILLVQLLSAFVRYSRPGGGWGFDGESWFVLLPQDAMESTHSAIARYVAHFRTTSGQSHDDALHMASGRRGHHIIAIRPDDQMLDALHEFVHPFGVPILIHVLDGLDEDIQGLLERWVEAGIRWEVNPND